MTLCTQPLPTKTAAAQAVVRLAMDKATATRIAASAAGIAFTAPDGATLYLKRAGDDHAGEWCFPGGSIEPGETPEQAAIRECREEIGAMPYGERRVLADLVTDGVRYATFVQPVAQRFTPKLNGEHSAFAWSENPPEPLHPGVRAALARGLRKTMAADAAMPAARRSTEGLAFDRATVRRIDQDGRMHVEITNISKANVCPYLGKEIPGWEELGLEEGRVYRLLRDPAELEKAAPTFNNLPLLSEHVPVSATDHQPAIVVGSTGTDAVFVAPYLRNSLVVWAAAAIEAIESGEQRELSCAYRYTPDMTPGNYQGMRFDGVMREMRGNHLALVATGRAGPDVVVGDSLPPSLPKKEPEMKSKPLSRHAVLTKGALLGLSASILAADSALDLNKLLAGVTAANWLNKKPGILAAIKPRMAADADIADVVKLLDGLDDDAAAGATDPDTDDKLDAVDADPCEALLAMLRGKLSDEDLAAFSEKLKGAMPAAAAQDSPGDPPAATALAKGAPFQPDPKMAPIDATPGKTAMDAAAVSKVVEAAVAGARKQARDAAEAREVVRPYVGNVAVALDSGEAVFKAALEMLDVKTDGLHPTAYRAVLEAQPLPGQERRTRMAQDAAPGADFAARFPGLANIRTV